MAGALAGAALAVALAPTAVATRHESQTYVGSMDPFVHTLSRWATDFERTTMCVDRARSAPGVAGACFFVRTGDSEVTITVADATGVSMNTMLAFRSGSGVAVGDMQYFCDAVTVNPPDNALWLVVVPSPYNTCAKRGVPTTGTIAASFT